MHIIFHGHLSNQRSSAARRHFFEKQIEAPNRRYTHLYNIQVVTFP